jgi:hypothetical protein
VGRCDARCYDAKHPDCDCICGGVNHGAGLNRAVDNTRELAGAWIEHAHASGMDFDRAELGTAVSAPTLFE